MWTLKLEKDKSLERTLEKLWHLRCNSEPMTSQQSLPAPQHGSAYWKRLDLIKETGAGMTEKSLSVALQSLPFLQQHILRPLSLEFLSHYAEHIP